MNATFTVYFMGFSEKAAHVLEAWLREDIAFYPKRMRMENASVEKVEPSIRRQSIEMRRKAKDNVDA